MKILVVDDNATNLKMLSSMVEKLRNCEPIPFLSPADALAAMPTLDFDVALLDYQMPAYNGVEFLAEMLRFEKYAYVPVIFVTADTDLTTRMDAINAGAIDFLTKPVDFAEFKARVQNIASLADARRKHAHQLADLGTIQANMSAAGDEETWSGPSVIELREREREIIHRMTLAIGYKDAQAARHGLRIAAYSAAIATAFGLSDEESYNIRLAAPIYDNAAALASDTAMLKQGKLTESGFRKLRRTQIAVETAAVSPIPLSPLQLATEIAGGYRERWDGQGYPHRLRGKEIPMSARIVAIAAAFDALISERPFKSAWPFEKAVEHIKSRAGSHYDPACVVAFVQALDDIRQIADTEMVPIGLAS